MELFFFPWCSSSRSSSIYVTVLTRRFHRQNRVIGRGEGGRIALAVSFISTHREEATEWQQTLTHGRERGTVENEQCRTECAQV